MPKTLFLICIISIVCYVLYQQGYISSLAVLNQTGEMTLNYVGDVLETDAARRQEIIVNENQTIWITEDGVKAVSLEGEEIWADTHTIKNIAVSQKSPYFAIGEKSGKVISIFDLHGKKADVKFSNPVVYFSINKQGDLVAIESTKDGHIVSGYNERGNSLGIKRITYIEDAGYPIIAEISPNAEVIVVSYLNTEGAQINSNIVGIATGSSGLTKVDSILYGRTYEDTIISEIEFLNNNIWIAIGDNRMIFNTLEGTEIKVIEGIYFNFISRLERLVDGQGVYYSAVSSVKPTHAIVHPVENLIFYSKEGETVGEIVLNDEVTYMYADGATTIIGSGRRFTAYNRLGKKRWEYTATKDIQKLIPLYPQQKVIMVSKNKVELMQVMK